MKLVRFSVTNFRSIDKAHNVPIFDTTVLVGKNSAGKSNLLQALSTAMRIINIHASMDKRRITALRRYSRDVYEWERDFPISKQSRKGQKKTVFHLEFELTEDEIAAFRDVIKSNLNGTLPLKITFDSKNDYEIKVNKSGKGSKSLNSKSAKIARYIAERISFNYIPAIRTDKQALEVIEHVLSEELRSLEKNDKYQEALETIQNIQKPVLSELSQKIKVPLSEFLPDIKSVQINLIEDVRRTMYRRNFDVVIDDGTPTSIEYKGDGVKSLATLGLLKNRVYQTDASIIAIEEPESHLHPGAIHQLQEIIGSLETDNQIVLSTHNPLFVNRREVKANILVDHGKATSAKNIEMIRDNLGVRVSDNLTSARYVLVVEGEEDVIALKSLLSVLSDKLKEALQNHSFIILPIRGAGKLTYQLSLLQSQLCVYHVLLDNDDAANKQKQAALQGGLMNQSQLTQTTCMRMQESEFEDCLNVEIYKDILLQKYGINLSCPEFRNDKNKWSARIKNSCINQGINCDKKLLADIKGTVAMCVKENASQALNEHKSGFIKSLIAKLELLTK